MATVKKAQVIITANASVAQRVLEELDGAAKRAANRMKSLTDTATPLKERMSQLAAEGKKDSEEFRRLDEQVKQLDKDYKAAEKEFQAFNTRVKENVKDIKRVEEVMKNLAGTATRDLRRALQAAKRELDKMSANDPRRQKLLTDMKLIQKQIDANTGAIKAQGNAFATTAKNLATYMIGFAGFNKIKSLVEGVFEANTKLSDSLANIRKVSGLSTEAINQLYRNIAKIDTRNTIETLNQLAYTGAKLGIGQNYGVEGLTGFVKAAEQVQMALGEDMGEKALPELSKMVEVMGLIPKYGVEQSMQKAASAIFQLGATSTATGSNIVEFSKRLMGLANVSRVSTQDLLALGSASDAMGLMPEVSATAFNKLFTSLQKNHNLIEKSLDIPKDTIKNLYDAGKTMDAMVLIFEKMNQKGNMNLLGSVFKDLGSDGARLINVMATMSDRVDILKKHLETSRDAFKEGEAVIGEYMIQNQTAAALMERAANLWTKAFTNPEGVDMVKELAQAWYDVSKAMTESDGLMKSLRNSISAISTAIWVLIKLFPYLVKFGIVFATAFGFKQMLFGIGSMIKAVRTLTIEIKAAGTAMGTLNAAMRSNWVLALISALTAAALLLWDFAKAEEEAAEREAERQKELQKSFAKSKEAIEEVAKPLERTKKAIDEMNISQEEKNKLLKDALKGDYQDYLDYLGIEIDEALDLAKAYAMVVKVMKQKKAYEERENYRTEKNGENRMDRIAAQAQVEAAARSAGIEGINKEYLEKNQYKGIDNLLKEIFEKKYGISAIKSEDGNVMFLEVNGKLVDKNSKYNKQTDKIRYRKFTDEALQRALNDYIVSYRTERDLNKEIDKMFNTEYKDIDLEHFSLEDFNDKVEKARFKRKGTLENDAKDKDAIAAAKRAAQERKQALRKEMEDARKDSEGIIAKIDEWYNLQEATIKDMQATGKITKEEAEQMTDYLNIQRNTTLMKARRALSSGEQAEFDEWNRFAKDELPDMLIATDKWSTDLLKDIQNVSIEKLHNTLKQFNGEKGVFGLDSSSFLDAIGKKGAANKLKINELRAKGTQRITKMLSQYHYVDLAQQQMQADLEQIGFMSETYEQWFERLRSGRELTAEEKATRRQNYNAMGEKFISQGTIPFTIDIENQDEALSWIRHFATDAGGELENWAKAFPQIIRWLDLLKQKEEALADGNQKDVKLIGSIIEDQMPDIKAYYETLMQWEGRYYDATKKSYQLLKKRFDEAWEISGTGKAVSDVLQQLNLRGRGLSLTGRNKGTNFQDVAGFSAMNEDPEIAQSILRMEQARRELELLKQINAQKKLEGEALAAHRQLMHEKEQAMAEAEMSMQEQLMKSINDRISKLQEWTAPIEAFGTEVGQALYDQWHNGESMSAKWQDMLKKMGLAWGQLTVKIISELMIQRIKQNIIDRAMQADAIKHQATLATIEQTGGQARQVVQQTTDQALVQGNQTTNSVIETQNQGHNAAMLSEDASAAAAENPVNISRAAGKTLAGLGWWGIPLVAVVTALLNALLQAALGSSKNNSSSSSSSNDAQKIKLVSGMLTYDAGNVGTYAGTDGHVYRAANNPAPGTGLITRPIATTVQGNPALVAERGPEIVIGRRATANIMRWNPALLNVLASYDPHSRRRTYDEGTTVPSAAPALPSGSPDGQDPRMEATLGQLAQTVALLSATVDNLQKNGIPATINKYGTGGLIDEVKSGLKFDSKYGH